MSYYISKITEKIFFSNQDFLPLLQRWKNQNKKIVFTNGCFDILHRGHADYLARAASLGDLLVTGLNTDPSIRRLKGNSRPVTDEYSRAFMLASFMFVDAVILFDEDTPLELIRFIQPNVLVKGSDYDKKNIVGADIVETNGGTIVTIDFVPGFSTSSIIHKIKDIVT
ncbi:MAG: D-glycero-beta-D-manno-heptose 1-phosphate adenylyltransferase [Bacteroidales bacterium]|jgi:rfaE bifunctional protein nucleotidyltransferase chain/domain|nr:D-glycero-beta-D-manno-heptose 1-phosphate adenylyltransferase [Bacteroidales bacterium]